MPTRAEHRTQTLLGLNAAAVDAIEALGPDVPLEQIAERAGVARRTIYRWVDSRHDLIFIHPRLWLEVFDAAATDARHEPLAQRVRAGCAAVSAMIDADPEPVARSLRVALAHPQLLRGYAAVNQEWIDRLAVEVRADDAETSTNRFRARAIAAAIMGMIDAALFEWVADDPHPSIGELVEEGLAHLAPLLMDA